MASVRELWYKLGLDSSQFKKGIGGVDASLAKLGKSFAIVGVAAAALGTKAAMMAAKYEQVRITFETLTGSAEKGRKVLQDLEKMAIRTPFESQDVIAAGQTLLNFGLEVDKLIPTLGRLGDLSKGNAEDFKTLARVYGQARAEGKLMSKDIREFITANIPIIKLLAVELGVAENQVFDLASKGKVSFEVLERAFEKATSEGGQFFGLMARQSTTTVGLFSTMADAVQILVRRLGEYLLPTLKEVFSIGIDLIDTWLGKLNDASTTDAPIRMAATFRAAFETIKVLAQSTSYVIQGIFQVMKQGFGTAMKAAGDITQFIGGVTNNAALSRTGIGMSGKAVTILDEATKKVKELNMLGEILAAQNGTLGETFNRTWQDAYDRIKATEQALKDYKTTLAETPTGDGGGGQGRPIVSPMQSLATGTAQSALGGLNLEEAVYSIDRLKGKIAEVKPNIGEFKDTLAEIFSPEQLSFAQTWANNFLGAFDAIIEGGKSFGKFMKQLFVDIIKQAIKALVITALLKLISGGTASFGDIFKMVAGIGLPKTASGGIVTSPQARVVGEAGPEAIIPLNRGSSKNMLGAMQGGGSGKVTGVIRGRDLHLVALMSQQDAMRRGSPIISF